MPLSTRDQVRLSIGDTNPNDPLLTDDELDSFITRRTVGDVVNVPAVAADAAGAIAAKFAREYSFSEDGQQFQRAQRVGHYLALERELRSRSGGYSVPVTTEG